MPALPSGNLPTDRPGARAYRGWAFYRATGIARLGLPRVWRGRDALPSDPRQHDR